ncbi:MAG TPA: LLM class flavin-dependent oxidoreductase [Thermoprotei archaeon]|nr:LLM class flavin-dependent oxidoreductase [Thermoprotei archaeon]
MSNKLKIGLFVPQGWRLDLPPDLPPAEQWSLIVKVAKRAEELGFDSLWVFDHFHTVPQPLKGRSVFEAWTTLTALAAVTNKIRLGTLVTCVLYRYPTVLAKIVANVDVISNGRVEFGIGACWYENEFRGYGIPFPKPADRIKALE